MLEKIGSWLTGIAGRALEIVCMVLFSAVSKLEVSVLLLQIGTLCSSSPCDASKAAYQSQSST